MKVGPTEQMKANGESEIKTSPKVTQSAIDDLKV